MRQQFPVFDLHCDTAVELFAQKKDWGSSDLHVDLTRAGQLLHHIQVYSFCCVYGPRGEALTREEAEEKFIASVSAFYTELQRHKDTHRLCRCAEDMLAAAKQGKQSVFLSLEGPEVIGCDPGRLEELKELGIVMTTLTWNHANLLAGSHKTGEGLTPQGKAFVRRAQELGIVIDVSHLSDRAFRDLCDVTTAPIVASHSNSRAVCGNSRNLTDEQFKIICNFGGLVGLNLYAPFLRENGQADFSDFKRHMDHFLELGGAHHLALGGDLDGCDALPIGFTGIQSWNDLGRYLLQSGCEEEQLLHVFNNNAVHFFLQHLQKRRVGEFLRQDGQI